MTISVSQAPNILAALGKGYPAVMECIRSNDDVHTASGLGYARGDAYISFMDGSAIRIQPDRCVLTVWDKCLMKDLPELLDTVEY